MYKSIIVLLTAAGLTLAPNVASAEKMMPQPKDKSFQLAVVYIVVPSHTQYKKHGYRYHYRDYYRYHQGIIYGKGYWHKHPGQGWHRHFHQGWHVHYR